MTDPANADAVLGQLTFESIEMLCSFKQSGSFKEVARGFHRDERTVSRQLIDLDRAFWASHHVHILEREPQRRIYRLTQAGMNLVNSLTAISDMARNAISAAASAAGCGPMQTYTADADQEAFAISPPGSVHLAPPPESYQFLAAIVDSSSDAIVSTSLDGTILTWNGAAARMYGYTEREALHQPIDIVIPEDPERRQEELEIRARIARGDSIQPYETIRRHKDGTQFDVLLSISPVRDGSGHVMASAGFARDISEQRRLEEERRRTTGLLTRFADFSAHDFKTPMQHIVWDSEAAVAELGSNASRRVRQLLDRIISSSRWMQSRTEGLRAASGLTEGRSPLRDWVRSEKIFDEAHSTLAAVDQLVQEATVTRDPLPVIVSNEVLLGFLFQNLLQNACKYGRSGVPVTVHLTAKRLNDGWQFLVIDNGRGIAPDRMNTIFEPYVRGENVEVGEPGYGIGLSFCRAIVEWHQGRIWAESNKGPGTTFNFTIPDLQVANGR